jgi:hypothetical protein
VDRNKESSHLDFLTLQMRLICDDAVKGMFNRSTSLLDDVHVVIGPRPPSHYDTLRDDLRNIISSYFRHSAPLHKNLLYALILD